MTVKGLVFNIQRFSIHDGPGIRTTVFLKGCNLRCFWCHNPESWEPGPQLQFFPSKCIGCGACFEACSRGCHEIKDGERVFHREHCAACGACARECYAEALVLTGYPLSVDRLIEEVRRDEVFYRNSGGGVTFSGGESMLQIDFLEAALAACRENGLHTAVDTAGNVPYSYFERVLPYTDLFLFDLKHIDPERHRQGTGADNARIVDNLTRLAHRGADKVWVRIPVIPGLNDSPGGMEAIADFLRTLPPPARVELLPYHRLGESKLAGLGLPRRARIEPPARERMDRLTGIFTARGVAAVHA
ncbi:MAG: glycyl-radical enzyme activating protein [Christensenellales bacterium]|jgi:glycyl-radical enzyme activating protein